MCPAGCFECVVTMPRTAVQLLAIATDQPEVEARLAALNERLVELEGKAAAFKEAVEVRSRPAINNGTATVCCRFMTW